VWRFQNEAQARAGGLEIVVNAALKERSGTWFGWSGKIQTHGTIAARKIVHKDITFITIDLSREDHKNTIVVLPTAFSGRSFTIALTWPNFRTAT
jgi:trehalose-6-phosphate synthase